MKAQSLMCYRFGLRTILCLGFAALLLLVVPAVADTGQAAGINQETSADASQMSFWITDPYTRKSIKVNTGEPDMTLWNAQRIKDYQDSLMIDAEPPIGVITIEAVNIQIPIYNGAEDLNLNRGVGRIKGMAWMNETGNLGIAGHRDGVFRGLKDTKKGDLIEVLSIDGVQNYEVSSITIVDQSEISPMDPTPDKTLTLVTCYPFYHIGHAPQRYIVKAKAVQ